MPLINDRNDWWVVVDKYWDGLVEIIARFMDLDHAAYETPGDATSKPTGRTIAGEIDYLKERYAVKLARYFHAAWALAPDSYAHTVPAWGALCDLCSEEYVLYEDDDDGWFV